MPLSMEKSHVPSPSSQDPSDEEEQKDETRRIKVRVSLYYDGTQNNRANTNVRKNAQRWQRETKLSDAEYKKDVGLFVKYGSSGSSYDNDESNVSRLEGQSTKQAPGYDYYFSVYTEGIGTINEGADSLAGQVLGAFETGIHAKVDKGIKEALGGMRNNLPSGVIIEELAIDTCGFSRGAAAARFAIHRALNDETRGPSSLKTSLENNGFTVKQVKVVAVCLFDSVSSYGLPFQHKNNVKKLKLDAIRHAKAVLQLAAAEEYRENFSLTMIESAKDRGRHVYLPGAHSDVGGCYEDGLEEKKRLYKGRGSDIIAKFLLERGWYTKRQLKLDDDLTVERSGLLKEYSYIPLQIMAAFAKKQGLQFKEDLEETFKLRTTKSAPAEPTPIGAALVEKIKSYADTVSDSKPTDWEMPRDDLNQLRNGYLHIPFVASTGLRVRLTKSGRPYRLTYHDA